VRGSRRSRGAASARPREAAVPGRSRAKRCGLASGSTAERSYSRPGWREGTAARVAVALSWPTRKRVAYVRSIPKCLNEAAIDLPRSPTLARVPIPPLELSSGRPHRRRVARGRRLRHRYARERSSPGDPATLGRRLASAAVFDGAHALIFRTGRTDSSLIETNRVAPARVKRLLGGPAAPCLSG
jgi:hypothetical protein